VVVCEWHCLTVGADVIRARPAGAVLTGQTKLSSELLKVLFSQQLFKSKI